MTPPQEHNSTPRDVIIVGAARTPIGRLLGALSSVPATELGSTAIARALKQAHVDPTEVNAVIMGQVLQTSSPGRRHPPRGPHRHGQQSLSLRTHRN